ELLKPIDVSQELKLLCEYARHRLNFDFDRAQSALQPIVDLGEGLTARTAPPHLPDDLEKLVQRQDFEALIREVYFNALITYGQGRYVDFLLRLFRFHESVLRYVVERDLKLPTHAVNHGPAPEFIAGILADEQVAEHMRTPIREDRVLEWETKP